MKRLYITVTSFIFFILLVSFAYSEQSIIRILHVNDFHGFAEPYRPVSSVENLGGIIYLASEVNKLRKEKPSLLLSAGDMIQGNNWANFFQGSSVIDLMNEMAFDAMVAGNHEFDFGQDILRQLIKEAKFPVLGANVEGLGNMLRPYVIKNVSGIKVAVIGIVTEDTPVTTHPKNIYGLKFYSVEDTVRKYINDLKDTVDVIVVLSHIGHNLDRLLAEKVKGIDIIIGGHSHTKIVTPVLIGKTIILQAWEHGKALGVLDLYLEDGKIVKSEGRLIEIRPSAGSEDKAAKAIVNKYCQKIDSLMDDKIGETEVNLDGENARIRETNLGNFIADIIRNTAGAEVAIIGGGSIRTGIKKGDIRVRDIYSVSPFNNYIVAIKLTGRQIKKALEHGLSSIEEREGSFPQVSGLRFIYSRSEPAGYKIGEILIAGRRIENDKEYVVATNDFLAAGGDGYKVFAEALEPLEDPAASGGLIKGEKLVYSNSGRWLRDIIIEHIRERGKIAPYADGRIIETR